MQSFWAMVVANLKMTVRNRQAIFWNLAFPAIFIIIFGTVFGGDATSSFDVGVTGPQSAVREQVTAGLEANEGFNVHTGNQDDEFDALNNNDRQIVLVVPEAISAANPIGFYYNAQGGPTGSIAQAAVQNALLGILGQAGGVPIEANPVSTLDINFIDFFIPGILAMSIMNSGVIGLSTAFTSFREKGILRRIKVTPFALWKFILARIVASMLVILATSAILIGLASLVWGFELRGSWLLSLLVIVVGSLTFLSIGYAISSFARNTEAAASYANLVTFPMLFLSGVFFPVTSMPDWLQPILNVLPLKYLVDALRQPMMYGRGLGDVWLDLLALLAVFAACMAFAVRFFRWEATTR
ncbi:MAG: ABC transporter permease [Chloroflexota bacterium]|nr:ABC transporter permease [Chloroflexota bacterium]